MSKFSLYELSVGATAGPFNNNNNHEVIRDSMMEKARLSLKLSNDAHAYQRVIYALEKGAFNRKIILDGDSLTRQLFISLSCIAWSSGNVENYAINNYDVWTGGQNEILRKLNYTASERFFKDVHVQLKGGGDIYYIDYFNHHKMPHDQMAGRMVRDACGSWPRQQFRTRYSLSNNGLLDLEKDDVVVLAAGHHESSRETYITAYKKLLQCRKDDATNDKHRLKEWPHFFYQLSSVQSFWTSDGEYSSPAISDKDPMTCQPKVSGAKLQEQDLAAFKGFVPLIANEMNLKEMGEYHVGHGDCTHWIQPGIPDMFAAQLADELVKRLPRHKCREHLQYSHGFVISTVGIVFICLFFASVLSLREQTKQHICKE